MARSAAESLADTRTPARLLGVPGGPVELEASNRLIPEDCTETRAEFRQHLLVTSIQSSQRVPSLDVDLPHPEQSDAGVSNIPSKMVLECSDGSDDNRYETVTTAALPEGCGKTDASHVDRHMISIPPSAPKDESVLPNGVEQVSRMRRDTSELSSTGVVSRVISSGGSTKNDGVVRPTEQHVHYRALGFEQDETHQVRTDGVAVERVSEYPQSSVRARVYTEDTNRQEFPDSDSSEGPCIQAVHQNTQRRFDLRHTHTAASKYAPERPHAAQVVRQVVRTLTSVDEIAGQKISIRLEPEQLGDVWLEVCAKPEGVSARFEVGTTAAKEAIQDGMQLLKDALISRGLSVDQLSVSMNLGREMPEGRRSPFQKKQRAALFGTEPLRAVPKARVHPERLSGLLDMIV